MVVLPVLLACAVVSWGTTEGAYRALGRAERSRVVESWVEAVASTAERVWWMNSCALVVWRSESRTARSTRALISFRTAPV